MKDDNFQTQNKKIETLRKLSKIFVFLSIGILIIGIILSVSSSVSNDISFAVLISGISLVIISGFISSLLRLVILIKKAKEYNNEIETKNLDEKEEERVLKETINSTSHNRDTVNLRSMSMYLKTLKESPRDKSASAYIGLFFIILFVLCIIGFVVFSTMGNILVALICIGVAFLSIIILMIYHLVHKKIANSDKNIDYSISYQATVTACVMSDESSVSSGARCNNTSRVLSTTYLVYLDVYGEQKKAYSKTFYNKGDKVLVYANKKLKNMVKIVEK